MTEKPKIWSDLVAIAALSGIIASTDDESTWITADRAAALAYESADAMMKERAK